MTAGDTVGDHDHEIMMIRHGGQLQCELELNSGSEVIISDDNHDLPVQS
jgi:hypothetical protein